MRRNSTRIKQQAEEESAIDMTPMLDIVFIMLIFFIVTSTFVKETGITVARPDASTATKQTQIAILIAVDEGGQIWLNRQRIPLAAVRGLVERLRAENPQGGAVVQVDKAARTGILVAVMDRLRQAGVKKISIATGNDKK